MVDNIDELIEYLVATDQVDEFFGLKDEKDAEDDKEKEEENNKGRRR